ncbi:MAG: hypothetical protein WA123_01890 [Methylotenera sp.]
MLSALNLFMAANATLLMVVAALATVIVVLSQQSMRFWILDLIVTFPFIGLIARYSTITSKGSDGWMSAEEKLCAKYKPYISLMPERKFNQRIEYMRNAGDLGRTPMPTGLKALLFVLVIAEGLGFSYILGTWMAREGSANTHNMLMVAIVFVIGVILALITHAAGHQYHRTTLLRSCFQRYKEKNGNEYASKTVALNDNQEVDANEADYTRRLNRVANDHHDKGSYSWSWVAGSFIVAIFLLSTIMRISNLESELTRETTQQSQTAEANPFANALPDEVMVPQQNADKKAREDIAASTGMEGIAAILMLGFIFVVTQIVGFGAGYKYGFSGKETYKRAAGSNAFWFWAQKDGAYADTGGFSTYDRYWETFQPLVDIVNGRLKDLQQRLKQHAHENLTLNKTFSNYLEEQQVNTNLSRSKMNREVVIEPESSQPLATTVPSETLSLLNQAKKDIAGLADKPAQIDYFLKLPTNIQAELSPWLKQRKDEEAAKQKVNLEELF